MCLPILLTDHFLQGRPRGSISLQVLDFHRAVQSLLEQRLADCLVWIALSPRYNEGVIDASVRLLSPPAVPLQHRASGIGDLLSMPGLPYSTDHARVEVHQRAAVTSQRYFEVFVEVLRQELRKASLTLIQRAHGQLSHVS